jgi:hypothetical protein
MIKNGTPWFFKRSFDLLPAVLLLMAKELFSIALRKNHDEVAQVHFPQFSQIEDSANDSSEMMRVS